MPSNIEKVGVLDEFYEYMKYRDQMKTGDLIEFASSTPLGWIIRKGTGCNVNHTAFAWQIDSYKLLEDRVFLLEALTTGLEWNSLSARMAAFKGKVYWSKLNIPQDTRDEMLAIAIQKSTRVHKQKRYDFVSLLRNAYRTVNINEKAWFCSEFYHYLLIAVGLLPHGERARRPGQFKDQFFSKPELIYTSD